MKIIKEVRHRKFWKKGHFYKNTKSAEELKKQKKMLGEGNEYVANMRVVVSVPSSIQINFNFYA